MDSKLLEYERLLASWPGLVSQRERADTRALVEDSLVLLDHLEGAGSVVDVGSGGGMPGLPLKIARPELAVTLIEADRRKAAFLEHAIAMLDLDVEVIAERAEDVGRGARRETFDLAVSRALASMPVVVELCLPLVVVGGRLLAMKGGVEDGGRAASLLGGGPPVVVAAPSRARPGGVVVVVDKVAPTPEAYPRRAGTPARRPLVK